MSSYSQLQLPNLELQGRALHNIFNGIPEIRNLGTTQKSRFSEFIEQKLAALALKTQLSPYKDHRTNDPLQVTSSLPQAVSRWLDQFPAEYRLGYLLGVLSIVYITKVEEDTFLEIATQGLCDRILERAGRPPAPFTELDQDLRNSFRVYPISVFAQFSDFVHLLHISGLRDRDKHPFRGTIDVTISDLATSLRHLAENKPGLIYYDEHEDTLTQFIRSVVDCNIVLIEDCSYSGTRITGNVTKFLRILEILFEPYEHLIEDKGYRLPRVYLLVSYGTHAALEKVSSENINSERGISYQYYEPLFGHVFEDHESARHGIPSSLDPLRTILPESDLDQKLLTSTRHFLDNFGHRYVAETGIAEAGITADDMHLGFKNGGWTILSHQNSPNNALTYLWYPHTDSDLSLIKALFPRVDSHITHANPPNPAGAIIRQASAGPSDFLTTALTKIYTNKLAAKKLEAPHA